MLLDELRKKREQYKIELEERIKVLEDLKQSIEKNVQRRGEIRKEIDELLGRIRALLAEKEKLRSTISEARARRSIWKRYCR